MQTPSNVSDPTASRIPTRTLTSAQGQLAQDIRLAQLHTWLTGQTGHARFTLAPASSDASFRRYFRVSLPEGATKIAMDAPPDKEDCHPFLHAAHELGKSGVQVPRILAQDLEQGFLLLDDFGPTTYLDALNQGIAPEPLYRDALAALVQMQVGANPSAFKSYDRQRLTDEMALFPQWYITRHKGLEVTAAMQATLDHAFGLLADVALAQTQVVVHRDYHSRNLMHTAPGSSFRNPGILDFQDAVTGPITYDLVSLLRDAYVEWQEPQVLDWAIRYWEMGRKAGLVLPEAFGDFYQQFEWMGLQRHLKILGIFARLHHRDGKDGYLKDLPLVLRYARKTCERYGVFRSLLRLLESIEGDPAKPAYSF
jgi:N-acetylmuramate 1-kinase